MKNKFSSKEKIVLGVVVLFLITPIIASLSYAEFVEHLWTLGLMPQNERYSAISSHEVNSDDSDNSFINNNYSAHHITQALNPYVIMSLIGILGVCMYIVYRSNKQISKYHIR